MKTAIVKNYLARMRKRLVQASVLLLTCGLLPAYADNLVGLVSTDVAALPAAAQRLLVVDGTPIALGASGNWVYEADRNRWQSLPGKFDGNLIGLAGNARQVYGLFGAAGDAADDAPAFVRAALLKFDGSLSASATLPPLPVLLASVSGALLGEKLYVAGNTADGAVSLYVITPGSERPVWAHHAGWPAAGTVTSLVAQNAGLFVTLRDAGRGDRMLRWSVDKGWIEKSRLAGTVVSGSVRASGQAHVLYLLAGDGATSLASFHTTTGSWAPLGQTAEASVAIAAGWRNGVLWAKPDVTGMRLGLLELASTKIMLGWLDWVVIISYLAAMLGMGFYFYIREKRTSTADFFVGGRSIPFWAAGISLYATNTSSISYIAIPAKSFETNWQYLTNNLVAVVGLMFVAVWIVPLLRRLNLMSVFHYLEIRFHPVIRMLASALCILVQIGSRLSVILFLPSLAIATITGIDVTWSILMMGGFTMVYTAMGGMKAVIWTDFVQLFVKMGGAVFAIGFIIWKLEGGFGEFMTTAAAEDKMRLFDFSFDLTKATVWGFIFLVVFDVVLTFPKDQVLMQRVLSTKNASDASRSIWMFAAIMIPGGFVFYTIGTALYVFYKAHPERMNPLLSIDATFPLFIAAELPMGIRGLIIAGIFAAAMATLSSIMNSVATLASVDFYEKLVKNPDPKKSVRFAEIMTVVTGLVGIAAAMALARYDIHSLFDISIELAGVLGGGFAGAYTLGMFTRRANWQGVTIGVAMSIVLTTLAWTMKLVHPYFYLAISIFLCIFFGYIASWLFPAPSDAALEGLTIIAPPGKR